MKGVFSCFKYECGDVYTVNLLMKNIGIFVVFIATVFLSTKSIWAKLIYLDSLSPLSVLAYRALLSLPFFILPMIHFNWQSVNKKRVFKYSFVICTHFPGHILFTSLNTWMLPCILQGASILFFSGSFCCCNS